MSNQCKNCGSNLVISERLIWLANEGVAVEGLCTVCGEFVKHIDFAESRLIKQLDADPIPSALLRFLK